MSIESYIRAMPKVDLDIQLEGSLPRDLLMLIAEQIDIASSYKKRRDYNEWVSLLEDSPYTRFDETARETASWLRYPEDIARGVYEVGVSLHKQNVRYAEVSVVPPVFTETGMSYQQFLNAINDGRDRVQRAWGVTMNWIFSIPRDNPRKSDEISRWATSTTGRGGHVVGIGLVGKEDAQPIAQFKKAFQTAQKKEMPVVAHWHTGVDAEYSEDTLELAQPMRVTNCWGLVDDEDAMNILVENDIPIVVTPSRELRFGHIRDVANYPFQELLEQDIKIIFSSGMPSMYESSLVNEYLMAVQDGNLSLAQLREIASNAVEYSLLPEMEKADMYSQFQQAYNDLEAEHLSDEPESEEAE
jgi:adenosine deaminase